MTYTLLALISGRITGKALNMREYKAKEALLKKALVDLERRLNKHAYLCGDEKTIADLSAACELDNGCMIGLDMAWLREKYPRTAQWF